MRPELNRTKLSWPPPDAAIATSTQIEGVLIIRRLTVEENNSYERRPVQRRLKLALTNLPKLTGGVGNLAERLLDQPRTGTSPLRLSSRDPALRVCRDPGSL